MPFDLKEDTTWTPKKGDLTIISTTSRSHRLGILWKSKTRNIQYFRHKVWDRVLDFLRGLTSKPRVSTMESVVRPYSDEPTPVWQGKIAPISFELLTSQNKTMVRDIQDELDLPREPLFE